MMKNEYKIGQLAEIFELTVETLRYYDSQGLLTSKTRSPSGYRLYDEQDRRNLSFILHAKKVGFSLKEIKFLLNLQLNKSQHSCEEVKDYTGNKIQEIETKISDLQNMLSALNTLHQACCGGEESAQSCSILQALEDSKFETKEVKTKAVKTKAIVSH